MKTIIADRRWAKKYPKLGTGPISAESCVSAEYFELERERIFRRSWLNVGAVWEIPGPGDYFVRDLAVCNVSILVMRGRDKEVRAFYNVCSHRGNKLVANARGTCRGYLTCNFHSWGYDSTGNLKWVPDEVNFYDLNKSELGLTPVPTEVWNGFIFINLDPNPRENLISYLDGVAERIKGGDFDKITLAQCCKFDEKANWKVGIDAQNEIYHVPFQHRYIIPDRFVANENNLTRVQDVTFFGRHSVYSCEINTGHKPVPMEQRIAELDRAPTRCRMPMIGDFDFYVIFPNFVMIFFRGANNDLCLTYNFWPLAVDRTIWEARAYLPPPANAAERLVQEFICTRLRIVFEEDAAGHETVHAGLATRAKKNIFFQDEEIQLRYFHKIVEDHMQSVENQANGRAEV